MAIRTVYICSSCGDQSSRWQGKCTSCGEWNTLVEDAVDTKQKKTVVVRPSEVHTVTKAGSAPDRLMTGIEEFDRVMGGGFVSDGLVLLTGDPGIGKSTLALQVALQLAKAGVQTLYVSGEESVLQVSDRARRLVPEVERLTSFRLLSETSLEAVMATVDKVRPGFVVADSVQTFCSDMVPGVAGSVSQTRYVADQFMVVAKQKGIPALLIGHVTKDGNLAGPKVLEHLVDTVLFFEGDRYHDLRILRSQKNRFGSTMEVGVFKMLGSGLVEVANPSADFLEGRKSDSVGSAISVTLEGTRPFLVEVQALTNSTDFNYPKRTASGMDTNRLQLLTAVLSKHAKVRLDEQDVYTNIAGGFSVREPAVDLAVATAILSSRLDISIPPSVVVFGEIGLSGEVRPVPQEERRIREAEKLGFTEVWGHVRGKFDGVTKVTGVADLKRLIESCGSVQRGIHPRGDRRVDPVLIADNQS